ncbi:MFS transporter [Nocardioides pantholopis]|uniref:MFS transporter n=1 Tax=Nocardioides pantholopis TaxID=2483798 RepID=UPI000FDB77D8|nr:MFS transporter [Nocardioides pantholopis]
MSGGSAGRRGLPAPIYLLAVATFVVGTDKDLLVGILPELSADLDTSAGLVVQLATVFALTYAVAAPVLAVTLAGWPRRRLMLAALGVFTAGNLLCALAPSYEVLLAGRVVAALGAAAFTPTAAAAGAAAAGPDRSGRALAVVFAGFSLASVAGVPLGTLVGQQAGWRWVFAAIAGLGLLVALGLARFLGPQAPGQVAGLADRVAVLRDARVRRVLAVSGTAQAAGFAFFLLVSVHAEHVTGDAALVPLLVLCFGLFGLAGTWAAGRASDRADPVLALRAAVALAALALLAMPLLARGPVSLVALVSVWAFAQWAITVPVQACLLRLQPATGSIAVSLNSSAMYLGSAVAGLVAAGAAGTVGIGWLPGVAGLLLALAGALALTVRLRPATGPAAAGVPLPT